jgi:soluble lytic murein transglycosylase-like protein
MLRFHTFVLVLLAFGLLTGGSTAPLRNVAAGEELPMATVLPVDHAERIAGIVQAYNGVLSDVESERIGRAVVKSASRHGLEPELVTAVLLVESGGRPWARSRAGAVGLMQVMPHMAATMDLAGNLTTVESNIEAGCVILADNIRRLGENDGISAYFWGSNIRGVAYLDRVRAARDAVRRSSES